MKRKKLGDSETAQTNSGEDSVGAEMKPQSCFDTANTARARAAAELHSCTEVSATAFRSPRVNQINFDSAFVSLLASARNPGLSLKIYRSPYLFNYWKSCFGI